MLLHICASLRSICGPNSTNAMQSSLHIFQMDFLHCFEIIMLAVVYCGEKSFSYNTLLNYCSPLSGLRRLQHRFLQQLRNIVLQFLAEKLLINKLKHHFNELQNGPQQYFLGKKKKTATSAMGEFMLHKHHIPSIQSQPAREK